MQLSLTRGGLLAKGELDKWTQAEHGRIRRGMERAMRTGAPSIVAAGRANIRAGLRGNKVANSFRHRIYARDQSRMPDMHFFSKVPWLGVHERGATMSGRMLIPLGAGARMRRREFRSFLQKLFAAGRAYYVRSGRNLVLMARQAGKGDGLARFRKGLRQRRAEMGMSTRVSRKEAVPVAVFVTRVTVKRRLNLERTVRQGLPGVVRLFRLGD